MLSAFPHEEQKKEKRGEQPSPSNQGQSQLANNRLMDVLQLSQLSGTTFLPSCATTLTRAGTNNAIHGTTTQHDTDNASCNAQVVKSRVRTSGVAASATIAHLASGNSTQPMDIDPPCLPTGQLATPTLKKSTATTKKALEQVALASNLTSPFPFMIHPEVCGLSMQEIAKEAMRIAKESVRKQQQEALAMETGLVHTTHAPPASKATEKVNALPNPPRETPRAKSPSTLPTKAANTPMNSSLRLNKFVRRLHDMVKAEQDKGIVEWRRGLLVLHSTATFAKNILPKFFNTRNFKTFRRQLNYYGFVHVRSFSNTAASTTTALWVHQDLAATLHGMAGRGCQAEDPDDLGHILKLRRVEPNDDHKTVEGRRQRKEMALYTVEEDLQVSTKTLQRQQIQSLLNMSSSAARPAATEEAPPQSLPAAATSESKVTHAGISVPSIISVPKQDQKVHQVAHKTVDTTRSAPSKKSACSRSVSDGSVGSIAAVSASSAEAEEEAAPPATNTVEDSAANLLLLLSRGS